MSWIQWYQNQPHTTAPYSPHSKPHMALFRTPTQNPHSGSPFKRELLVVEKWARYQNNQHGWSESNGTKINPIWPPHMAPIQASYSPIQNPIQNPHSGSHSKRTIGHRKNKPDIKMISTMSWIQWYQNQSRTAPIQASYGPIQRPLTAPYRSPIQKRTVSHRKVSQISKRSAQWDKFNGIKISPIQPPHMAPIQASYGPIQNPHSRSLLRIPIQRRYIPCTASQDTQSVQLNKQRKMHPLRPPEHSQQPNQCHTK